MSRWLAPGAMALLLVAAGDSTRFEVEFPVTSFAAGDVSGVTSQNGKIGSSRIANGTLCYDFRFRPGYVGVGLRTRPIPGIPYRFALTAKGDSSFHPVVLRVRDARGETFQRMLGILDRPGRRTWQVGFGAEEGWFSFGGDGRIDYPVRASEVMLEEHGTGDRGQVQLIELRAQTRVSGEEAVLVTVKPRSSGAHSFTAFWRNLLARRVEAGLEYSVTDVSGRLLDSGSEQMTLGPKAAGHIVLGPAAQAVPVQCAQLRLKAMGTTSGVEAIMVNPVPFPRTKSPAPGSPFGMGIYFGNRYSPEEMHRAAEMAMDAGVKWSREEFSWSRIEPQKGTFEWEVYDRAVSVATAHGISLLGLLDYWSGWTKPYTSEGIADFCEYVRRTVSRYKDRIHYWEIWNEPNAKGFWEGTPEQYADLLKAAAATCKRANPNCKVVALSTAGVDLRFMEKVASLGALENADIVSVHPYKYPKTPEEADLIGDLRRAADLLARHGKPMPLWVTEVGYPTHKGEKGTTPLRQAQMLVRTYLHCIASGVVEKVFWYDYRDDGDDPAYNEHNFGIIRRNLEPKPAYAAFSVMTAALEGMNFAEQLPLGKGVIAYRFQSRDRSKSALAAWTVNGEQDVSVPASAPVTVLDMAGAKRLVRPLSGHVNLTLTASPLIAIGQM